MDKKVIEKNLLDWLLDTDDLPLRYRILTELLDVSHDDPAVAELKKDLGSSKPVVTLLNSMSPEGFWTQSKSSNGEIVGQGVEYGSFATTHFCLSYLSELGMTREHPLIAKASERYLNLQAPDGDWWYHLSCLNGYNLRTFVRLGYRTDPRIQKTIDGLLTIERKDGGYLCDIHEKPKFVDGKRIVKNKKSCIRGAVKVLLAFSDLPEYWDHPRIKDLVEYFLKREGIYPKRDKTKRVNNDMERFSFPITWAAKSFDILYALATMGYGSDMRLSRAWNYLESKCLPNGRYLLGWTPTQCPWKVGKAGKENRWITFYALLAQKYR